MKRLLALVLTGIMAFSLAACSVSPAAPAAAPAAEAEAKTAEPIVIKVSHTMSATSDLNKQVLEAADRIAERTNGAVVLEVHPSGELITYADAVEAILGGAALFYFNNFGEWKDYAPDATIVQAAMLFHSSDEYWKFMDSDLFKKCCGDLAAAGIHLVQSGFCGGFRYMVADQPITSLADAQKLKIRVPNTFSWLEAYDNWGGFGVGMSSSETKTALSTGILNGVDQTIAQFYDGSYYDYCKYINLIPTMIQCDNFVCSQEFWDTLPEEYQAIISEEFEAAAKRFTENTPVIEADYIEKIKDLGVELVEVDYSEFSEKQEEVIQKYTYGQEMLDTLAEIRGEK